MVTFSAKSSVSAMEISYGSVDLPCGRALLGVCSGKLCYLGFSDCGIDALSDLRGRWRGAVLAPLSDDLLRDWQGRLERFCAGEIDAAGIDLVLVGSEFDHRVWGELLKIKRGETSTYAAVASAIGSRGVRAVGSAVGRNPVSLIVPCHRVLRSDGELGGYYWGLKKKSAILLAEGVRKGVN